MKMVMRKIKNTRGQGHVEMILSFVLFVGALIVLFIFINPFAKTEEVSVIEGIQERIIDEISLEIGRLSAIVENEAIDCYSLSGLSYGANYIEKQDSNNLRKYDIYFSDNFGPGSISCAGLAGTSYSLGTYSIEKMIGYNKTEDLVTDYNEDYEVLKQELGITSEFVFSFTNLLGVVDSDLAVSKQPPTGVNVEAKEFPVRVIDNNADIQELILNIRAWD
jgi:hypothetical protein